MHVVMVICEISDLAFCASRDWGQNWGGGGGTPVPPKERPTEMLPNNLALTDHLY